MKLGERHIGRGEWDIFYCILVHEILKKKETVREGATTPKYSACTAQRSYLSNPLYWIKNILWILVWKHILLIPGLGRIEADIFL